MLGEGEKCDVNYMPEKSILSCVSELSVVGDVTWFKVVVFEAAKFEK